VCGWFWLGDDERLCKCGNGLSVSGHEFSCVVGGWQGVSLRWVECWGGGVELFGLMN